MLLVLQNLNHIPIAISDTPQGIRIAAGNDEALVNGELVGSHLALTDLFCLLQQPRSLYVIVDDSLLELPVHLEASEVVRVDELEHPVHNIDFFHWCSDLAINIY